MAKGGRLSLAKRRQPSRVPVIIDGKDTGYEVELAQVVYGKKIPILKLAVYEKDNEVAGLRLGGLHLGSTEQSAIGINLRWMQAGLTASNL